MCLVLCNPGIDFGEKFTLSLELWIDPRRPRLFQIRCKILQPCRWEAQCTLVQQNEIIDYKHDYYDVQVPMMKREWQLNRGRICPFGRLCQWSCFGYNNHFLKHNGKKCICFAHDQARKFEPAKSLLLTNSVQYSIKQMQNPVTNNCCAYWWRAATYFCCFWLPNHVEEANKVHEDGVRVDATRPVAAVGIDARAEGRTSESAGAVE